LAAIARLGLRPDECLVVEDNPNGILAGQRAGAHVMQVATVEEVNLANILENIRIAEQQEAVPA
jgi:beta-phosphoglucomutase-like phosphatase (HAD superfamily)